MEKTLGVFTGRLAAVSVAAILLVSLILASCVSTPSVATDVGFCCAPRASEIKTYRIAFAEMPEFLKPMLRDEASIALDAKGLEYTEGDADADLVMTYVNRTLEGGEAVRDEAWETIAPGGGIRFIAEVRLEMTDVLSGELLWSGTMGRVHNVYEGSYMHAAPGRAGMRNGFQSLFSEFPTSLPE
jgi:hypothetical protein